MSNTQVTADLVRKAPLIFKGWHHLGGALSVALPASLRNANRLASTVLRVR